MTPLRSSATPPVSDFTRDRSAKAASASAAKARAASRHFAGSAFSPAVARRARASASADSASCVSSASGGSQPRRRASSSLRDTSIDSSVSFMLCEASTKTRTRPRSPTTLRWCSTGPVSIRIARKTTVMRITGSSQRSRLAFVRVSRRYSDHARTASASATDAPTQGFQSPMKRRFMLALSPREELFEDHFDEDQADHQGQEELPDLLPEAALLVERAVVVERLHHRRAHRLGDALDLGVRELRQVGFLPVHVDDEVDAVVVRGVQHVEPRPLRLAELRDRAGALGLDHDLAGPALGVGEDALLAGVRRGEERDQRL